jgi:hypothetical protein
MKTALPPPAIACALAASLVEEIASYKKIGRADAPKNARMRASESFGSSCGRKAFCIGCSLFFLYILSQRNLLVKGRQRPRLFLFSSLKI